MNRVVEVLVGEAHEPRSGSTCGAAQVPGHRLRPRIRQSHRVHHRAPAGRSGDAGRRVAGTGLPGHRAADDVPEPQATQRAEVAAGLVEPAARPIGFRNWRPAKRDSSTGSSIAPPRRGQGRGARARRSRRGERPRAASRRRAGARGPGTSSRAPRHRPHHAIMRAMSDDLVGRLIEVSELHGDFVLSSGRRSGVYFDKFLFLTRPDLLRGLAHAVTDLLPDGTDHLAAPEAPLPCCSPRSRSRPGCRWRSSARSRRRPTMSQVEGYARRAPACA